MWHGHGAGVVAFLLSIVVKTISFIPTPCDKERMQRESWTVMKVGGSVQLERKVA